MNKKIVSLICIILSLVLSFFVVGCSSKKDTADKASSKPASSENTPSGSDNIDNDLVDDGSGDDNSDLTDDGDDVDELDPIEDTYLEELGIHNVNPITTNFKGINGIYQLYNGMTDSYNRVYNEAQTKTEFDRLQNMGVKIIRSYYGSGLAWDAKKQQFDFNKTDMQTFFKNCREMEKRGIEVGITPQWQFKGLINSDIDMTTEAINVDIGKAYGIYVAGNPEQTFKNLGEFMRQSVLAFKANGVNNIKYLFAFTECNNTFLPNWDGNITENRQYEKLAPLFGDAITKLDAGLKASGFRNNYKIVAPCDNWTGEDNLDYSYLVNYTLEHLADKVDIIGSHNGYDRAKDYTEDNFVYIPQETISSTVQKSVSKGKEFWIDEYNVAVTGLSTCEDLRTSNENTWKGTALGAMTTSIMNMGVSTTFLWSLVDQQWPNNTTANSEFDNGIQIGGYSKTLFESYTPYAAWYACSLITKYIGQGKVYLCDEGWGVYAAYIERNDGNITLLAVNYNFEDTNIKYVFDKHLKGKTLYKRVYNPVTVKPTPDAKITNISAKASNVKEGFYDTLKAGEVAVYSTIKD